MHPQGIRSAVLRACEQIMSPLARLFVRSGVSYKEFAEVAKRAFVDVVSKDYGIRGRQTNISRVAVLTGLTRKEVSRIRRWENTATEMPSSPRCRPEQVLEAWYRLEEYTDEDGQPIIISANGEEPSFAQLVRIVGGDIPHGAMLKELIRAGSVEECGDDHYRAVSKSFMPDATDPESILLAGEAIHDLIQTISSNLFLVDKDQRKLERRVYSDRLSPREAVKLERIAREKGIQLLEELDDYIASHETWTSDSRQGKKRVRVGLGIYLFEDKRET